MVVIKKPHYGGRKKIEIKKIEVTNKRQVTFSKRKAGIFSKAGQLCTLTGAEAAIVVFSPQGSKVYSYGHPSADTVIDRYFTGDDNHQPSVLMDADEYNKQYEEASKVLEMEKKRGAMIEEKKKRNDYNALWWEDQPMEGLEMEELDQYTASLKEFRKNVAFRIQELSDGMNMNNNSNNDYYAPAMPYLAMDSSLSMNGGAVPVNNALTYNQPARFGGDTRVHNLGFGYDGHGKI